MSKTQPKKIEFDASWLVRHRSLDSFAIVRVLTAVVAATFLESCSLFTFFFFFLNFLFPLCLDSTLRQLFIGVNMDFFTTYISTFLYLWLNVKFDEYVIVIQDTYKAGKVVFGSFVTDISLII